MKCQFCEKPATFHITELTEPGGPQVMHLCEEHARGFLQKEAATPVASIAGALAKRIVNYAKEGEEVVQGTDAGFIKFGSRVDVFLPIGTKVNVKIGDTVKGGVQAIAEK